MATVSVYLTDDEDDFVKEHIGKLTPYVRKHIQKDMDCLPEIQASVNKQKAISGIIYGFFLVIGFFFLLVAIFINTSALNSVINVSYSSLLLIIVGIVLEVYAIFKLKNGKRKAI